MVQKKTFSIVGEIVRLKSVTEFQKQNLSQRQFFNVCVVRTGMCVLFLAEEGASYGRRVHE